MLFKLILCEFKRFALQRKKSEIKFIFKKEVNNI